MKKFLLVSAIIISVATNSIHSQTMENVYNSSFALDSMEECGVFGCANAGMDESHTAMTPVNCVDHCLREAMVDFSSNASTFSAVIIFAIAMLAGSAFFPKIFSRLRSEYFADILRKIFLKRKLASVILLN